MLNKRQLRRTVTGLLACTVVVMTGIARAQGDYATTVLAQNPVAYWRLNETAQPPAADAALNSGSLGAAADGFYVANAIHPEPGALVGEPANTAASFAGGARVAIPYQPELNPQGAFTVECWAYKDAGSGYPLGTISALQYAGGAERRGWLIYDNDTSWQFRLGDGGGYVANIGGGTADVGAWYHLVGVYDGAEAILYVNGTEVARTALTRPFEANPSVAMDIGSASAFGRHFAGVIDEVAVYPSALGAADVQAHYQNGTNPSPSTPYSQLVQTQNPLGYWRLSEPAYNPPTVLPSADNLGSDGAAADGSYNPGMEPGVPGSSYTGFGTDNKAGGFNGLVGHVGTPTTLNNLAQFTVMGWVKRGTSHSTRGGYFGQNDLLEFGDAGGGASMEAWINAYGANIVVPYPFEDDQWGFIALVGDGTQAVLYANGLPVATRAGTVASYGSSAYNFNIGGGGIFNATGDYFLGNIDEVAIFDKALSAQQILDIFSAANVPPWITSQPVAPARELYAGNPVTLSVTAAGPEPLTYQWRKEGVDLSGQNSADLVFTHITEADTGSYDVVVSNDYGQATSVAVSLLVNPPETTAPALLYATGNDLFNKVRVWFSEPLDPTTAQNPANYQLSGGVTITAAALSAPAGADGDHMVELTTSTQTPGQIYTLTVSGVNDQVIPPNTIAAGSTVEFSSWVLYSGYLKFEIWEGLSTSDNSLHNTLLADPRYPDFPDSVTYATAFNTRTVYPDDSHEGYGGRMSGLLIPTETANYQFFLRSDDSSELYLSTSADPQDAVMIAEETDCCDAFVEQDQANDDGVTYATSYPAVELQAGQQYYIAAAWKEGTGGDYCQVAWRKDTDSTPAGQLTPIGPEHLAVAVDPNVDMQFVTQPTDQVGVLPSTGIEFYAQDFNANDGGFTVVNTDPAPPGPWVYNGSAGQWAADGAESGCTGPYNSQLNSSPITVTQDGTVSLSFTHRYSFEGDLWDGGQVRISVNGGGFTLVPAENFSANGYAEGLIQGSGVANGQRAFNGDSAGYANSEFITSTALLGTFRQNDTVVVQFLGAWDDCTTGSVPGWVIDSLQLELVPMMIQDFVDDDGGFTVENDPPTPPGAWGPWIYGGTEGQWAADGSDTECGGPFNSKLTSPAYIVPQTDEVTLTFTHRYRFEGDLWDGGQVRISVNGGAFTPVGANQFSANGYAPGTIQGNGILNGQPAFNGDSAGYDNGEFIQSSAVLGQFNQGDTLAVQFVGGWDDCWSPGQPGWVIKGLQLAFGRAAQVSTFSCDVSALLQGKELTIGYQWQRDDGAGWADIPYANGPSYAIYPTPADFAALFRVVAAVPGKSLVSNEVKLLTEAVADPEITINAAGNVITVTFTGTLQSATTVDGTYTDVQGAQSPYEITDPAGSLFLRSRQ